MTRRARRGCIGGVLLAAIAMVAGCGNGGQSTATPSSTTGAPSTVPVTIAQSTTTVAQLGPNAPTDTTAAPEVDPQIEQAIKQGIQDFFAAYMACGQAPATCHPADFHSGRGTAVGQGTVYFQGLAARGEHFASDLRGSYIVTQSVALDDATSAVTFSCWYDASILLGPVGADGQPTVLNENKISVREKQALYFDGVAWKVGEAATVQDLGDGNQCPPPADETTTSVGAG